MAQTGIGGGLAQQQARSQHVPDSLGMITDQLAVLGYDGIEFEPRGVEWTATSFHGSYRAAAGGRTKVAAAQALVRSITGDFRR